MKHKFRRKFFTPNIKEKISEHVNSLSELHEGELVIFKDKDGNDINSVLAKVTDMNLFIDEIVKIRNIQNPVVVLGSDGGQNNSSMLSSIKSY